MQVVDINMPKDWIDLSQPQLKWVFALISIGVNVDELKTHAFLHFSELKVLSADLENMRFYLKKKGGDSFSLNIEQIAGALSALDFLARPSAGYPVRIEKIGRRMAVNADLRGMRFEHYLACDMLYQSYLSISAGEGRQGGDVNKKKADDIIDRMASMLYPSKRTKVMAVIERNFDVDVPIVPIKLAPFERLSVAYWFISARNWLTRRFSNLYSSSRDGEGENLLGDGLSSGERMMKNIETQVRALTNGDVSKTNKIYAMETWAALSELDARAREAAEIKRKYSKK